MASKRTLETSVRKSASDSPRMDARKKFEGYKDIEKQEVRQIQNTAPFPALTRAWEIYIDSPNKGKWPWFDNPKYSYGDYYDPEFSKLVKGRTPEEIEGFCLFLPLLEEIYQGKIKFAGEFLNLLIQNGDGEDYVVHTAHFREPPDCLGDGNTKNILVKGDAGPLTGRKMESGKIIVEGDSGEWTAQWLRGGVIIIHGSILGDWGDNMKGGELHVYGDLPPVNYAKTIDGGRIYHKGVLIEEFDERWHAGRVIDAQRWKRIRKELGQDTD